MFGSFSEQDALVEKLGVRLCALESDVLASALRLIRSGGANVRAAVMTLIGECDRDCIGDAEALEGLRRGIEDESTSVRLRALAAMYRRGAALNGLVPLAIASCSG